MTPAQREILEDVAWRRKVTVADLIGRDVKRQYSWPRQEAMWRMRRTGKWTTTQIGRVFGRDASTVVQSCDAYECRSNNLLTVRAKRERNRNICLSDSANIGTLAA